MADENNGNRRVLKMRSKSNRNRGAKPYSRPKNAEKGFLGRIKEFVVASWPFRVFSGDGDVESMEKAEETSSDEDSSQKLTISEQIRETRSHLDNASEPTTPNQDKDREEKDERNETDHHHLQEERVLDGAHGNHSQYLNKSNRLPGPSTVKSSSVWPNFNEMPSSDKRHRMFDGGGPVKRKCFDFSESGFALPRTAESPFQSSFYAGRTSYGGSSASRPLSVKRVRRDYDSPIESVQAPPVVKRIKAQDANEDQLGNVVMSQTAKRILEALESVSSPLQDARRIPQSLLFPARSPISFKPSPGFWRRGKARAPSHHSQTKKKVLKQPSLLLSSFASKRLPVASLGIPVISVPNLFPTPQQSPDEIEINLPDQPTKPSSQKISFSTPLSQRTDSAKERHQSSGSSGGKMKVTRQSLHHVRRREEEDEMAEVPDLPEVPLPLAVGSFPKINFGLSSVNVMTSTPSSSSSSGGITFQFAEPGVKAPAEMAFDKADGISFKFSKPREPPSTPPKNSHQLGSDKKVTSVVFPNLIQKPGEWSCSVCLVENEKAAEKCRSCREPNPQMQKKGTSLAFKPPPQEGKGDPPTNAPFAFPLLQRKDDHGPTVESTLSKTLQPSSHTESLSSSMTAISNTPFPNLVTHPGDWQCSECLVQNEKELVSCKACSTSKQKDKEKEKPSSSSSGGSAGGFSFGLPKPGMWSCDTCLVANEKELTKCKACETPKAAAASNKGGQSSSLSQAEKKESSKLGGSGSVLLFGGLPKPGMWSCDTCLVENEKELMKCKACEMPKAMASAGDNGQGLQKESKTPFGSASGIPKLGIQFGEAGGFKLGGGLSLGSSSLSSSFAEEKRVDIAGRGGGGFKLLSGLGKDEGLKLSGLEKKVTETVTEQKKENDKFKLTNRFDALAEKGPSSFDKERKEKEDKPAEDRGALVSSSSLSSKLTLAERLGPLVPQKQGIMAPSPVPSVAATGFKLTGTGGETSHALPSSSLFSLSSSSSSAAPPFSGLTTAKPSFILHSPGGGGFPLQPKSLAGSEQSTVSAPPTLKSSLAQPPPPPFTLKTSEESSTPSIAQLAASGKLTLQSALEESKETLPPPALGKKDLTSFPPGPGPSLLALSGKPPPFNLNVGSKSGGFQLNVPKTSSSSSGSGGLSVVFGQQAKQPADHQQQGGIPTTFINSQNNKPKFPALFSFSNAKGTGGSSPAPSLPSLSAPPPPAAPVPTEEKFSFANAAAQVKPTSLFQFSGTQSTQSALTPSTQSSFPSGNTPFQFSGTSQPEVPPGGGRGGPSPFTGNPFGGGAGATTQQQPTSILSSAAPIIRFGSTAPAPPSVAAVDHSASPQPFQFSGRATNSPAVQLAGATPPASSSLLMNSPFRFPQPGASPANPSLGQMAGSQAFSAAGISGYDFSKSASGGNFGFGGGSGASGSQTPPVNPFSGSVGRGQGAGSGEPRRIKKGVRRFPQRKN